MVFSLSSTKAKAKEGELYLKLQLDSSTQAVFAMKYAQEVLIVPNQKVASIPNTLPHIVGLVNRRNQAYWLIDLALLLGLNFNAKRVREYNVAFVEVNNISVGLLVEKIKGVTRIELENITTSMNDITSKMIPYLDGYLVDKEQLTYVLDPMAVTNHSIINS